MKNKKLINRIFQRENIYFHLTIPLLTLLLLRVVIGDTDSLIFTIFLIIAIPWFFVSAIFWIFSFLGKGDIRVNDIDGKVDKQRVSIIQFHNDALRFVFIISVIVGLFVLDFTEGKNLSSVSLSSNFGQLFGFSLFFVFIYFIGRWELKKNQKDRNRIRRGVIVWAILLISISLSLFSEKTKTAQLQETALWQNPLIGRRNIGDIEGSRVVITEKEKIEIERNRIELEKIKKVAKERLQEQKQIYLQTNKSANYSEQIDDLYRNTKYNFRMKFPQGWDIKSNDSINSILQKEVPNIVYQADNDNYYIIVLAEEMPERYEGEILTIKELGSLTKWKNISLQYIKTRAPDANLIDYGESKLGNDPAYWIKSSFAYTVLGITMQTTALQYQVLNNNILYTINMGAPSDEFDMAESEFMKSIETFVIEDPQQ